MIARTLLAALAAAGALSAAAQTGEPDDKRYRPGYGQPPAGSWQAAPSGGLLSLYNRRHFQGLLANITGPVPDFERLRINDAAASLVVREGTWELCTDANFRGECRIYGPGQYDTIPDGHDDAYSSARPVVRGQGQGRWGQGQGGWGHVEKAEVRLYDRRHFERPLRTLTGAVPDFGPLGFNDAVASLEVRLGTWEFCTDANFRGVCRIYGPGQYPVIQEGLDDSYSSARPVTDNRRQGPAWRR